MFKAVASGELLIDFNSVSADEMGYPTLAGHPGGATINCLATLRTFGAEAAFIGKAGNDTDGIRNTFSLCRRTGLCRRKANYLAPEIQHRCFET